MIGLIALGVIILWFVAAAMLSARIPRWLGLKTHHRALSIVLFPLILAAPLADEFIGRWQFKRLCEREATVNLSPDWEKVKRAKRISRPTTAIQGAVIPISAQGGEYRDVDSGMVFLLTKSLFAPGGVLLRHLFPWGTGLACHPQRIDEIELQINLIQLLERGEKK